MSDWKTIYCLGLAGRWNYNCCQYLPKIHIFFFLIRKTLQIFYVASHFLLSFCQLHKCDWVDDNFPRLSSWDAGESQLNHVSELCYSLFKSNLHASDDFFQLNDTNYIFIL